MGILKKLFTNNTSNDAENENQGNFSENILTESEASCQEEESVQKLNRLDVRKHPVPKRLSHIEYSEIMYDKTYTCPVCNKEFKSKTLKGGKNRLVGMDIDLKPYYDLVDPSLYAVLHCSCGYTALSQDFDKLSMAQVKLLQEGVCSKFVEVGRNEFRTIKEGINLYKLALLNAMVRGAKESEKGYICLKLAWLYRDLDDKVNEKTYLNHALKGLMFAVDDGRFPLFGMSEDATRLVVATINYMLDKDSDALKYIESLMYDRNVKSNIKDKARELRNIIKGNQIK